MNDYDIPTKDCVDCGPQPIWDFYKHPRTIDGLNSYCRTCHKRRATIGVMRRRERNKQAGLPCSFTGPLVEPAGYLERHTQRRAEEAAVEAAYMREKQESSPVNERGLLLISNEESCFWTTAINSMLSLPKKSFKWSTF